MVATYDIFSTHHVDVFPKSGIGVTGPFLIIDRPLNRRIVLDCRFLDDVRDCSKRALAPGKVIGGGALTYSLFMVSPWLGAALLPAAFMLATRKNAHLEISCGSFRVLLEVADGAEVAAQIEERLASFTRKSSISTMAAYHDAKRRLEAALSGASAPLKNTTRLLVGNDPVLVKDEFLHIGTRSFHLSQVNQLATSGENLMLEEGDAIQAAIAMLMVAVIRASEEPVDCEALANQIAEYESWALRPGHA